VSAGVTASVSAKTRLVVARPGCRAQEEEEEESRPLRNYLLPFDERFEVVESLFETLAVHPLIHERIRILPNTPPGKL
jgi:hypothetical protein